MAGLWLGREFFQNVFHGSFFLISISFHIYIFVNRSSRNHRVPYMRHC